MSTLILTGATGYLGSYLAYALVAAGHKVVVLKRTHSDCSRIKPLLSSLHVFDIEDGLATPFQIMGRVDAVIHTATCYGRNGEGTTTIFDVNTAFPLHLLEIADSFNTKNFFNADTILFKYLNAYSLSKHQFMEWGKSYAQVGGIRFINLKLEHMYGPGDDSSKFTTNIINSCLSNVAELQLTPGEQRRDFIHIDDVVAAYECLLANAEGLKAGFLEFGVGTGRARSIRNFANTVQRLTKSRTKLMFGALPYREHENMHSEADVSGLKALGWMCRYDLEDGLNLVIEAERNK